MTVALAAEVINVTVDGQLILHPAAPIAVHWAKLEVLTFGLVADALIKPLDGLPLGRVSVTVKLAAPPESVVIVEVPSGVGTKPRNSSPGPEQAVPRKNCKVIVVFGVAVRLPVTTMLVASGVIEAAPAEGTLAVEVAPGNALVNLGGVTPSLAPADRNMP